MISTTNTVTLNRGMYGFNLYITLYDSDGAVENLTGYDLRMIVYGPRSSRDVLFLGAMTIDVATNGTCYLPVTSSMLVKPGSYLMVVAGALTPGADLLIWGPCEFIIRDVPLVVTGDFT